MEEKEALTLNYHPPLAWPVSLKFLADRAVPGVESVESNRYSRAVVIGESQGWIVVEPAKRENALRAEISPSLVETLSPLLARIKNLFDLDARPQLIEAQLSQDPRLSQIVKQQSGLRLPGAFDGFEMAVRAVLGQQISVRAARTLAGRMTESFGDPIETPNPNLNRLPVNAKRLAEANAADLTGLGLTRSRAECLLALARAVAASDLKLEPGVDVESTIERRFPRGEIEQHFRGPPERITGTGKSQEDCPTKE